MTTTTPATTPDARAMPTIEALYAAGDSVKSGDEAAFETLLRGADGGGDVSVRQLAATLLKAHAAVRLEAASAALIALCEDAELRVRLTAIGALPSLCTAAGSDGAQLRRTTAAVLGAALRLSAAQTKEGRLALTVTTTLARERPAAAVHAVVPPKAAASRSAPKEERTSSEAAWPRCAERSSTPSITQRSPWN